MAWSVTALASTEGFFSIFAYSGASDHAFRRHPIADSGVSDHPGLPPLSVVS